VYVGRELYCKYKLIGFPAWFKQPCHGSTVCMIFFLCTNILAWLSHTDVCLIQAPDGESQPSTEVDLFISTEKIMVLNTDLKVRDLILGCLNKYVHFLVS
jgi:hypothetical protein